MDKFPSIKGRKLLAILQRKPLSYEIVRQKGSHRWMESSEGYPPIEIAFHEGKTVPPTALKKILLNDVGLTAKEARELI